ncbi:hypothetical protein ES705_15243 [subsurface metagenome]
MGKKIKINQIITTLLVITSISLISIRIMPSLYAQGNGESEIFDLKFEIIEFSEKSETILNQRSINLEFPSSKWNVSNIRLNFTNIEIEKEMIEVETEDSGSKNLNKQKPGYAVQINVTEPLFISAVEIFGQLGNPATTTNITVQINGYETGTNAPNSTVYGSTPINISSDLGWYIQTFSSPIYLSPGNYFLILNGTAMTTADTGRYYWYYNDFNPNHPELYFSEYSIKWKDGEQGSPFLYKLYRKSGIKINPEDVNMTAEIFNESYVISNSLKPGTGNLSISNLNYSPDTENYTIAIRNNQSLELIFNVSYFVSMDNLLISQGSVLIEENKENIWNLTPIITSASDNYRIEIHYPKSWHNIVIKRDMVDITSDINITFDSINNIIFIPNAVIIAGTDWAITANSPQINIGLNIPENQFEPDQELKFSLLEPVIPGNYTFILYDSLNFEVSRENKIVPPDSTIFSYNIPLNPQKGIYKAFVYLCNGTDAGVQYQEFQIIIPPIPFTIAPLMIILIVLILISVLIISIISYITIKKIRNQQAEKKQKLYNSCIDSLNLDYIMVSDKKSGLNVYTQNLSEKTIDATLISGFLQAIHSFGIELIKVEDQSQTIKLEYKDSIILMSEFVNIRLILIMKERPSRFFLYSIEELAYDIYKNYGNLIDTFNGDVKPFQPIEPLLKQHLNVSFVYPLRISQIEKLEKIRITQSERVYINKAVALMKTKNMNHFYIKSLLPGKECSPKDVETILNLIEKKIFQLFITT